MVTKWRDDLILAVRILCSEEQTERISASIFRSRAVLHSLDCVLLYKSDILRKM